MAKKKNPCKGKDGKVLLKCQYDNKVISQKKYIRKMRKFSGKKMSLAEKSGLDYTLGGLSSRGKTKK